MSKCDTCRKEKCFQRSIYVVGCSQYEVNPKYMTNADRIRAMTDEELAEFLADDYRACPKKHPNCRKYIDKCDGCWLEWLKQPAEE